MKEYKRNIINILRQRLMEPRRFIQVLSGPRQAGKTTLVVQLREMLALPTHYASADEPGGRDRVWLEQQWEIGRLRAREGSGEGGALLVLDEAQKIIGWSEVVKRLWDDDTASRRPLKVVLLDSAPLLVQAGLTESLAGRFEVIPVRHWSCPEMQAAFGWTLDQYIYFGGYPGAATLIADEARWAGYIRESIVETSVGRDLLMMRRVDKPVLLRRLFQLACDCSGQILAYQKMLGQLQDAGNTTTLAHYLELLSGTGLVTGLPKFSERRVRQRASSPKLQVLNTALMTATGSLRFDQTTQDRDSWGRLVESAVGAHLINSSAGTTIELYYWRERGMEVDFILRDGKRLTAIEVKSGRRKMSLPGIAEFVKRFRSVRSLLVGGDGISLEEFLSQPAGYWIEKPHGVGF